MFTKKIISFALCFIIISMSFPTFAYASFSPSSFLSENSEEMSEEYEKNSSEEDPYEEDPYEEDPYEEDPYENYSDSSSCSIDDICWDITKRIRLLNGNSLLDCYYDSARLIEINSLNNCNVESYVTDFRANIVEYRLKSKNSLNKERLHVLLNSNLIIYQLITDDYTNNYKFRYSYKNGVLELTNINTDSCVNLTLNNDKLSCCIKKFSPEFDDFELISDSIIKKMFFIITNNIKNMPEKVISNFIIPEE